MHQHSGGTLNQRLEEERGDLVRATIELFLQSREGGRAIAAGRRRDRNAVNQQRTEDPMKDVDAADTDGTERVAVIRVAEPKTALLRRTIAKLPVLKRLLQRDLDRGRSRV